MIGGLSWDRRWESFADMWPLARSCHCQWSLLVGVAKSKVVVVIQHMSVGQRLLIV